jgi:5-methylcytosine-specific restriction endonuclease McrA
MPFADPDYNRDYQRAWATKQREAKRAAAQAAHPLGPLGWEGERLIQKWVRYAERLLKHMINNSNWYEKNKEKIATDGREYYLKNKKTIRARNDRWTEANKDKVVAYKAQWVKDNPEKHKASQGRRRARKAQVAINDFTADQWREMKAAYGYRCVYCGTKTIALTQDHITPLSKGGNHTASNIVPACKSCNSKKNAGAPLKPVQPLLLTVAPSKKPKTS